jgi:hypothetical protein
MMLSNTPAQHNLEVVDVWGVEPQSVRRSIAGLTTSNSSHALQLQSTDRKCRAGWVGVLLVSDFRFAIAKPLLKTAIAKIRKMPTTIINTTSTPARTLASSQIHIRKEPRSLQG